MTKKEAIAFSISTGKPITHTSFTRDEYVKYIEDMLVDEEGYVLPINEFWAIRTGGVWENGWSEFIL